MTTHIESELIAKKVLFIVFITFLWIVITPIYIFLKKNLWLGIIIPSIFYIVILIIYLIFKKLTHKGAVARLEKEEFNYRETYFESLENDEVKYTEENKLIDDLINKKIKRK